MKYDNERVLKVFTLTIIFTFALLAVVLNGYSQSVSSLVKDLSNKDYHVRKRAKASLVNIGKPAVEALILAMKDESSGVKKEAAWILGRIGDSRAVDSLISALCAEKPYVRAEAAWALGAIKDTRATVALCEAINDRDPGVRSNAVKALGKIGDSRAVETLIGIVRGTDKFTRLDAVRALGEIRDPRAVEPLLTFSATFNDREPYNRHAKSALEKIGKPAVEPLLKALEGKNKYVRSEAASVLGEIGDSRAVEPLLSVLNDEDIDVRKSCARALEKLLDNRIPDIFLTALKNKDLEIVAGGHAFFIRKGQAGSEEVLIEALQACGDRRMATDFLNSGNSQLEEAARKWAKNQGYVISPGIGPGGSGPQWGD